MCFVSLAAGRSGGYRYFGAAKQLPGVKELFEIEPVKASRRTRHQMHKLIDPDYYGFRDEDDGVLVAQEATAEKALREKVGALAVGCDTGMLEHMVCVHVVADACCRAA